MQLLVEIFLFFGRSTMDSQEIYSRVSEHYSAAARSSNMAYGASVAQAFGYSDEELASIPKESNLGLSCGNPLAAATIKEVRQTL